MRWLNSFVHGEKRVIIESFATKRTKTLRISVAQVKTEIYFVLFDRQLKTVS